MFYDQISGQWKTIFSTATSNEDLLWDRGADKEGTSANIQFADKDGSNYVGFKAPETADENTLWTLPSADGDSGQVLSTDGEGKLFYTDQKGEEYLWDRNEKEFTTYLTHESDNVLIGANETRMTDKTLHLYRYLGTTSDAYSTIRFENMSKMFGEGTESRVWDNEKHNENPPDKSLDTEAYRRTFCYVLYCVFA